MPDAKADRSRLLAGILKFFADATAQRGLERLALRFDMAPQRCVDLRLVVAATGLLHVNLESLENVVVAPDGDAGLARLARQHRTTLGVREVVLVAHVSYHRRGDAQLGWLCVRRSLGLRPCDS